MTPSHFRQKTPASTPVIIISRDYETKNESLRNRNFPSQLSSCTSDQAGFSDPRIVGFGYGGRVMPLGSWLVFQVEIMVSTPRAMRVWTPDI